MIDLAMDNVEVKGLVIKKVTQTANGPITTVIKSNGTAKLKNMRVQITNLELGGIFIPKLGYLGMKKVKLLAYKQTADIADLPSFSFSFDTSSGSQMEDKTEDGLQEIIESLQKATAGEEEVNDESEDQAKEEESDKPSEETPVTEPEQPETETPATEPEPSVPTPTKPEEEDENPDGDQGEPDSPPVEDDPGETDPEPPTIPPTS